MASIQHLFPSYEQALSVCGKNYNDDDLATVVARKTIAIVPVLMQNPLDTDPITVSALAVSLARRNRNGAIRVLDIGGACGYAYFAVKGLLGNDLPLQWVVVETEAMVRQAKAHINIDELKFSSTVAEGLSLLGGGDAVDLVHTSSTIQYVPDPEQMIKDIVAIRAPVLAIARFPIYDGERCVGAQPSLLSHNGPGPMPPGLEDKQVVYPVTFLNKMIVAQLLLGSYDLVAQFLSPSSNYVVGTQQVGGASLLLRLKTG